MNKNSAVSKIIALMNDVISEGGGEKEIPEITNRKGLPVANESILVQITHNKARFPEWDFYTRTCQQTHKKIIGARSLKE